MAYPEIPQEIRDELFVLQNAAATAFQQGEWSKAADLFEQSYNFLLEQQQKYRSRFHKGWELHNWGIALLQLGEISDGITKFYMAYAEDALSAEVGAEDEIDEAPAGQMLVRFGAPAGMRKVIKAIAMGTKGAGRIPQIPDALLADVSLHLENFDSARASTIAQAEERVSPQRRRIDGGFTHPFERRCFVGGNYYGGGPNLEEIKQIVSKEGFDPIVAAEFEIGQADVHHRSLLLLHLCSRAIFEVTFPAGQLMELERCRDYNVSPLLLRNTIADHDPHVSAMIGSMSGYEVIPYWTNMTLRRLIKDYLTS